MVVVIPMMMEQYTTVSWLGVCLSYLSVMCLSGIHEVARELENPFRNVPNELPVVTFQAEYNEALLVIITWYHPDFFGRHRLTHMNHLPIM
jgi:predicted membrane chloride channel (bestrophin family)